MDIPPPAQDKASLRTWAKSARQSLPTEAISQRIAQHIMFSNLFQTATKIAIFYPLANEIDLRPLKQQHPEKQFFLPRVTDPDTGSLWEEMQFYPYLNDDTLIPGKMGLLEPPVFEEGKPEESEPKESRPPDLLFDLIIVPGLAFDQQGHRLGYGKGYYDRYLDRLAKLKYSPTTLGVIPSTLLLDKLPADANDRAVDWIVTEEGMIRVAS